MPARGRGQATAPCGGRSASVSSITAIAEGAAVVGVVVCINLVDGERPTNPDKQVPINKARYMAWRGRARA